MNKVSLWLNSWAKQSKEKLKMCVDVKCLHFPLKYWQFVLGIAFAPLHKFRFIPRNSQTIQIQTQCVTWGFTSCWIKWKPTADLLQMTILLEQSVMAVHGGQNDGKKTMAVLPLCLNIYVVIVWNRPNLCNCMSIYVFSSTNVFFSMTY